MSADAKLAAPVLVVTDLKEAIEWYEECLGFTSVYVNKKEGDDSGASWNYALVRNNNVEIHLASVDSTDPNLTSPTSCYLYLNELHDLHKRLVYIGAEVSELEKMPWGNTECWLLDPYKNRIVLSAAV